MSDWTKSKKELSNNKEIEKMSESASKFLGGVLGDISSRSAYSQLFIGVASGWATGYATGKIGKIAAFAIGGGIIVMEIAHQEGYIKVDWSKVTKKIDKVTDKVEEAVTGHERSWADKGKELVRNNSKFVIAFVGGAFLGLASA
ncbi:FUN14 domain-containing protein 1 isoform X2 [Episyrphus balteatus]|uniref:FUN14 domain-containing protein 1 isoform X2 n=1 Tax=Episyrphus balteatus TaxID=286459 RepID=UPI0024866E3C|nr:FUN14 domain-containing protein 1 isoform X2 [Episyrphus balteatus]